MMIRRALMLILCLCVCAVAIWAQPDPNRPEAGAGGNANRQQRQQQRQQPGNMWQGMLQQPTAMATDNQALFIYRNGVLAKFSGDAMAVTKQADLFGPLPDAPGADAAQADRMNYFAEVMKRALPATMLVHDQDLILVTAEQLFRIDLNTLDVLVNASLTPQQDQARQNRMGPGMFGGMEAPTIEIANNTAYVVRGAQLIGVRLDTGDITVNTPLPEEMMPKFANPGNFGNRGAAQDGVQNPAGNAPANANNLIVVGTVRFVNVQGGLWTIEARDGGKKYALAGDKARTLIETPNINGAQVRVAGTLNTRAGIAQYGDGSLNVREYQVLPRAN